MSTDMKTSEPADFATPSEAQSSRPIATAQLGIVEAAVWPNRDAEGNRRAISVSLTKRYFDGKEWKNSRCYLAPHEVSAAIAVLGAVQTALLSGAVNGNE